MFTRGILLKYFEGGVKCVDKIRSIFLTCRWGLFTNSFRNVACRLRSFEEDFEIVDIDFAGGTVAPARVEPFDADIDRMHSALVLGTRDYVTKNGFRDVVIGLSGGIVSSIVAAIAVDALGADHVHGVAMPSRYSSRGSLDDAATLAALLGGGGE